MPNENEEVVNESYDYVEKDETCCCEKEDCDCKKEDLPDASLSPEEKFNQEASQVPVPTSVAMNQLRQNINEVISHTPLHIECVLEVLRSACIAVEEVATQTAEREANEYYAKIGEIRNKYQQ